MKNAFCTTVPRTQARLHAIQYNYSNSETEGYSPQQMEILVIQLLAIRFCKASVPVHSKIICAGKSET
jgi:hypothetical protein